MKRIEEAMNENKFFLVDFFNNVVYLLDKDLKKRLARYPFENAVDVISFLIRKRKLKYSVYDFQRGSIKNTMPAEFQDIKTYVEENGISRQAVYLRIKSGRLLRLKKELYAFVAPNPKWKKKKSGDGGKFLRAYWAKKKERDEILKKIS